MLNLLNVQKKFEKYSSFQFKKEGDVLVLNDISLHANAGDRIGIIGKNGSGKSTLLKILFGSLLPDKGTIELDGSNKNFLDNTKNFSLFNNNERSFFWRLSVKDNLSYFTSLAGEESLKNAYNLAERFGCTSILDMPFYSLSSGQKKIALLIRGLIKNPTILFFDEFTQSLDLKNKMLIKNLLNEIKSDNKKIIFWVTHDLNELKNICNKIIYLNNGKIEYKDYDFSGSESDISKLENYLLYD